MNNYDLHIHTIYSKCSNLKPAEILKEAKKIGLNGIAITDHNEFRGAELAYKLNKDKHFEVIKGMELKTDKAELLCLYLNSPIKKHDFYEALDEIKKQDAIAIIAHPFSFWRAHLKLPLKNIRLPLEAYNGRAFAFENFRAKKAAEKYGLAKAAGSDAHFINELGRGLTMFEDDLRKALKKRKTIINGKQNLNISNLVRSVLIQWPGRY